MSGIGTFELYALIASGVLLVLALAFAALYFSNKATSAAALRAAHARAQRAEALQRQLSEQLNALQAQQANELRRIRAEFGRRSTTGTQNTPQALGATRIVPTLGATPFGASQVTREPETAMFQAPAAEAEINLELALPYLELTTAIDQGKRLPLRFESNSIGRGSGNTVVINDPSASRQHAEIYFAKGQLWLRDNGSRNRTYCNGQPVSETVLQLGDSLRFANTEAAFSLPGFELLQSDPPTALHALQQTLVLCPDFIPALRALAFLLERDLARQHEARALWERLKQLEKAS